MGCNVYMREVSNYELNCSWILLFAGWSAKKGDKQEGNERDWLHLTGDNQTDGEKWNITMHASFQWQRRMYLLLV